MSLVMRVDYRVWRQPAFLWAALGIALVTLVAVLFRAPINGTRRWFAIGGFGIQPSELAKLAIIFFTAAMLERRMQQVNDLKETLAPLGAIVGVMTGLILLEPDFGTSVCLVLTAGLMVFAAGLSWRYVAVTAGAGLAAGAALVLISPYRIRRVMSFVDPEADPQGSGFQLLQSLIAVGNGGVTGQGLMGGVQKLFYLPEPHTDFIYAVIAEELGLIGATCILICFCVIAWRGLRVASRAQDAFGAFVALGITTMIGVQALINMSVVLGMMPTKGIPLPLVSAGGSSLLINLLGMGILLNISQHESSE
jgi:cell division protein FtsW